METRKSKKYTAEFKKQAVQLAEDLGSAKKAAKQLGIPHSNIHTWKIKISTGQSLVRTSGINNLSMPLADSSSMEQENLRLRKEIAELKKVNHILKAATAIFTRDHLS